MAARAAMPLMAASVAPQLPLHAHAALQHWQTWVSVTRSRGSKTQPNERNIVGLLKTSENSVRNSTNQFCHFEVLQALAHSKKMQVGILFTLFAPTARVLHRQLLVAHKEQVQRNMPCQFCFGVWPGLTWRSHSSHGRSCASRCRRGLHSLSSA